MDLALYVDAQYLSPYAMSAYVALREKGVAFDLKTVDLSAGEQHQAAFAGLAFTHRVPALRHGSFALAESTAIAEYVDEVFAGTSLYPRQPQHKARARQIQSWLRSDLLPIRQERSTEVLFRQPSSVPLSSEAQACAAKLFAAVEAFLPEGATHLFGSWCLADTDLALMIQRLAHSGDAVPPRLARYAEQQWQRPSVQQWVAWAGVPR